MNIEDKKHSVYFPAVFFIVILIHAVILYCVSRLTHVTYHSKKEKLVNIQMVNLPDSKPVELIKPENDENHAMMPSEQSVNNEPITQKKNTEFTAPRKAPEKKLGAKPHQAIEDNQKIQVAKFQNMQTTQSDSPAGSNYSSTSLAHGNANQTLSKEKGNKSGNDAESTSPNQGKEINGGQGGGKTQGAGLISINKVYPENLKRNNVMGVVSVEVLVDVSGRAKSVTVINSSDPRLNEPGKRSAQLARYRPAMENGQKIEKKYVYHIKYDLK